MSDELRIVEGWPPGLENCDACELLEWLGGPALVHLPGLTGPALFVSVLLHGNETSGWDGVRQLVREHAMAAPLRRDLLLFIGNVRAAAVGVRTLPDQQDYNRIWQRARGPGGALASAVFQAIAGRPLFAAVDLHNNTGQNPHYAIFTGLERRHLGLAWLFDDQAVYVREPDTVLTRALADRCPAVALELGPIGDPRAAERAFDYLARLLAEARVPDPDLDRLRAYRTDARVHVAADVAFSFAGDGRDTPLVLTGGLEAVNFHELSAGTEFAASALPAARVLRVLDPDHVDVTERYFVSDGERLLLRRAVVPAMYTVDPAVVRQDCLCYFMSAMPLDGIER